MSADPTPDESEVLPPAPLLAAADVPSAPLPPPAHDPALPLDAAHAHVVGYTPVKTASYREIFQLAFPLVLSTCGMIAMHMLDRAFLGKYSEDAVAAAGSSGITTWVLLCLFVNAAGYSSALIAQYVGAGKENRSGAIAWQALYFALGSGALVASLSIFATPLFAWIGHDPQIQPLEAQFFRITCWGAPCYHAASALSGFFSGRGDNRTLMFAQLGGLLLNILLDYTLIFGHWGLPQWGLEGAATATVIAQAFIALTLFALMLRRKHRDLHGTWSGRGLDREIWGKLVRFGFPAGLRASTEIIAWAAFINYLGRIGKEELAASSIAFTINGLTFFPVFGLGAAIATIVGQAQGQQRPELAITGTKRGILLAEIWMGLGAVLFLSAPEFLYGQFFKPGMREIELGIVILRYVAVYSLLDGVNIILVSALQGAGDTRWTVTVSLLLHAGFIGVLAWLDHVHAGMHAEWIAAAFFVFFQCAFWVGRFKSGGWKKHRMAE